MKDVLQAFYLLKKIEESYPWWCITSRLKANWFVKQIRIERDLYREQLDEETFI